MGRVLEDNKRELLRKWLQGSTSPEEERQLRQWAKHDPFLSDAMEGYQAVENTDHTATVDALRQRILKGQKSSRGAIVKPISKSGGARMFSLSTLAIAASVIVVLGVGTWIWQNNGETKTAMESIADATPLPKTEPTVEKQAETALSEPEPIDNNGTDNGVGNPIAANTPESGILQQDVPVPTTITESTTTAIDETFADAPPIESDENIEAGIALNEAEAPIETENKRDLEAGALSSLSSRTPEPIQSATDEDVVAEKMEEINRPRPVVGYVYSSESGQPLSGAEVVVEDTDEMVLTDRSGRFQLMIDENISDLRVSHMGFSQAHVPVSAKDSSLVIAMNQDIAADQAIVYSDREAKRKTTAKKRKSASAAPTDKRSTTFSTNRSLAEPKGGFRKFEKYLAKNVQHPPIAKSNNIKGQVVLSFSVNQKGFIENIKVIKGLGYGCDEEAIRLLQSGPSWKNKTNYSSVTTSVIVTFD